MSITIMIQYLSTYVAGLSNISNTCMIRSCLEISPFSSTSFIKFSISSSSTYEFIWVSANILKKIGQSHLDIVGLEDVDKVFQTDPSIGVIVRLFNISVEHITLEKTSISRKLAGFHSMKYYDKIFCQRKCHFHSLEL